MTLDEGSYISLMARGQNRLSDWGGFSLGPAVVDLSVYKVIFFRQTERSQQKQMSLTGYLGPLDKPINIFFKVQSSNEKYMYLG